MHIWDVLVEIPHNPQLPSLHGMNIILKVRKLKKKKNIKNEYYTTVQHTAVGREEPLAFSIHRFKLEVELSLSPRENCEGGEKSCKIEQPKVK